MLTLVFTEGDVTLTLKLDQDVITLGRSKENIVVVTNRKASRKHAKIDRVGATYQITDLESGNGTRVNGKKVDFQALAKGDEIRIGDATLKVQGIDEEPDRVELDDKTPVDGELKIELKDDAPKTTEVATEVVAPRLRPKARAR
jgi:pSer/pThr/pTyr-binding forkhead associated (FHA) protein